MTRRYLYNGVELTDTSTRIRGEASSVSARADGSVATGTAIIKDPLGGLSYDLLRTFAIVEDACVPAPTLFMGMIYTISVGRGDYVTGRGRVWTIGFTDLNGLLYERVFHTKDAKRPRETGNARMNWLMAHALMVGRVWDSGQIGDLSDSFDAQDFRGYYPRDVVQSVMASSIEEGAKTFFVYLDQPSQHPSLFLHSPTATVLNSTLRISNIPADFDGITTFRPHPDPGAELAGDEIYDGVYFTTKNGSIYRQRAATFAAYPRHRDGTFSTDRINLGSTAERHAQMWLDRNGIRKDTVSLTVRLPPSKVGLIQAGSRLPIVLEHLPGYEDDVFTRVTVATLPIYEGALPFYDLQLELSTRGLFAAPGGDPGGYPAPPVAAPDVVQSVAGAPTAQALTLPTAPHVGNSLVLFNVGGGVGVTIPAGWTEHPAGPVGPVAPYMGVRGRMAWRAVGSGDTATIPVGTGGVEWSNLWEVTGLIPTVQFDSGAVSTLVKPATVTSGSILTTGPALILSGVMNSQHDWSGTGNQGISDDPAWTHSGKHEITNPDYTSGNDTGTFSGEVAQAAYQKVTTGAAYSPAYPLTGAAGNYGGWGGLMIAIAASAADDPPMAGQWVYNEVPTPAPDGATKTFTLRGGYVLNGIRVRVDGVPILNGLVQTNPAAGTFTLDFAPLGPSGGARGEIVMVDYQAQ